MLRVSPVGAGRGVRRLVSAAASVAGVQGGLALACWHLPGRAALQGGVGGLGPLAAFLGGLAVALGGQRR